MYVSKSMMCARAPREDAAEALIGTFRFFPI
jgi:hypothetical protein